MYCYLDFYIDKTPKKITAHKVLQIFEMFSEELGLSYDRINYLLFNPDATGMGTTINKKYRYNQNGKEKFLKEEIIPLITGKYGDTSAPFINAYTYEKKDVFFHNTEVLICFSKNSFPFKISVIYKRKDGRKISFQKYVNIIFKLKKIGFSVNNSFYHVYYRRNAVAPFIGMQIGSHSSVFEMLNRNNFFEHQKYNYLNHIMGIYCANSVVSNYLDEKTKQQIASYVGSNNVFETNDTFIFSLPNLERIKPIYRLKYIVLIYKLKRVIKKRES